MALHGWRKNTTLVVHLLILASINLTNLRQSSACSSIGVWREFDLKTRVFMADIVVYVEVLEHYHFDLSDEYSDAVWPEHPYSEFGYITLMKVLCHYYGEQLPRFVNVTGAGTRSGYKCTNEDAEIGRRYIAFLFRSDNYEEFGFPDDTLEIDPINKQRSLIEPSEENFREVMGVCKVAPNPVTGEGCPFSESPRSGSCYAYDDYAAKYIRKTGARSEMPDTTKLTAETTTRTATTTVHRLASNTKTENTKSPHGQASVITTNSSASPSACLPLVYVMLAISKWLH